MKAAVIVFPGSNCDRDLAEAFRKVGGVDPVMVWHKETELPPGIDVVGVPGGFSFGDYLRCGAIAGRSPIAKAVVDFAHRGGYVLGVCNGFQILTETGVLPGALMRNKELKFLCKQVELRVATSDSAFTSGWKKDARVTIPIAHHDGNYTADGATMDRLSGEDRVAFTYSDNPNGSMGSIAGVLSENRRVLGMMPHPERAIETRLGGADGSVLFRSLAGMMAAA
jgi:phosphoribosylformylglycinamidine synthase subunit PurQ / glutaminase